jgi:hypothetical protein
VPLPHLHLSAKPRTWRRCGAAWGRDAELTEHSLERLTGKALQGSQLFGGCLTNEYSNEEELPIHSSVEERLGHLDVAGHADTRVGLQCFTK